MMIMMISSYEILEVVEVNWQRREMTVAGIVSNFLIGTIA